MTTATARPALPAHCTPRDVAVSFGTNVSKVLGWIHDGTLPATNVAAKASGLPRWRISADDVAAFKAARAAVTTGEPEPCK
jgi:hypothetical protein